MNQKMNSQEIPNTSPSRVSYRVSIVSIWEKINLFYDGTTMYVEFTVEDTGLLFPDWRDS